MAIRPIIIAPDPRLKVACAAVARVDEDVRSLMDDLVETMRAANGLGLAAPQVGVARRVIVVDPAKGDAESEPLRMASPEILWASDQPFTYEEGCLSLPDHFAEVTRPERIRVRFLDAGNGVRELDAEGVLAVCIQHEMDHLDGVLFVDHISGLKRNIILRKLAKTKRQKEGVS